MKQMIFAFDIDETLLSTSQTLHLINNVERTVSNYDPYQGDFGTCYTLQKDKMTTIFRDILKNGDQIFFITAGSINKSEIKKFVESEYNINLDDKFKCYSNVKDKTNILKKIAKKKYCSEVVLIDNHHPHITSAQGAGFATIYADNNVSDESNGEKYIRLIKELISKQDIKQEFHVIYPASVKKYVRINESLSASMKKREEVLCKIKKEREEEKKKIFDKIKEIIGNLDIEETKKSDINKCQDLRSLCKVISHREAMSNLSLFKNTTQLSNKFIEELNDCKSYQLRLEISPHGELIRMRDVRSYAACGMKSASGYFFNTQDRKNEKHSETNETTSNLTSLIFQNQSESTFANNTSSDNGQSLHHENSVERSDGLRVTSL
ncbi:hypothetical protein [Piscirickettsia salmonis]|uniref:hypothetical protein n=1 Tax=Piscirickettsia salmonis TaxID=1238 RepID=UPI0007C883F9|nr:hypothetical protein A0O36_02639 [Piscirickettsiaceae bacterium NZ-RLO1]